MDLFDFFSSRFSSEFGTSGEDVPDQGRQRLQHVE